MTRRGQSLRLSALLSSGAVGVHELRYFVAYGDRASQELAHQGHGYMTAVVPLIALAFTGLLAHVVWRMVAGRPTERQWGRGSLTLVLAGALLAVYTGQELLEGHLAAGHASGLNGVVGSGGWFAIPLCLVVGALLACFVRRVDELAGTAVVDAVVATLRLLSDAAKHIPARALPCAPSPLAAHLAGRAPPHVSR
jgi:hypothetical protein